jgi:hypothetical protein
VHGKAIQFGVTGLVTLVLSASLASTFTTVGCGLQCDRNPDEPPVPYKAGITSNPDTPFAAYESAPSTGPFLDFPPGRTYRFFHALGAPPVSITAEFSFDEFPIASTNTAPDKSGAVTAAGNQFTKERVTATTFDVRNDTCSDVHLRVVATFPDFSQLDGGAPGPAPPEAGPAPPTDASRN